MTTAEIRNLPCPRCQTPNPVSKANVYLKCSSCGTQLKSVRVRKVKKNGRK